MRIGISVITHEGQNIWENGMGQNVLFLAQLLQRIDFVRKVVLVDVGNQSTMPSQVDMRSLGLDLVRPQQVTDTLDVVLEMAGVLPPEWLSLFRACGGKAAYMCVGQPFAGLVEPIVFTDRATFPRHDRCDEVWVLPKDAGFAPMLRTIHRCAVHTVPYIWSPMFLAQRALELTATGVSFGYRPGAAQAWRVAIFEPNISVVKSCVVPMLICDEAYRAQPLKIASMQALNTVHMKDHPTMLYMANSLDLVRQHKAVFHGRHDFAGFMAQYADAVVAHQWQNDQNYSYLDALYGGYPLVHNSPWLRDAGYYYPDFDIMAGAEQLLRAVREHDANIDAYRERARSVVASVDPAAKANIDCYAQRLLQLVGGNRDFKADAPRAKQGAAS